MSSIISNMYILLIIFFNWLILTSSIEYCDLKYCNSHGLCTLDSSARKKCECVENLFSGEKCESTIAYCDKKYCEEIETCLNFPGGYKCVCETGYGGQNCSRRSNHVFSNPLVVFNSVTQLNAEQYFIVFLDDLPSIEIMLDISTLNYMVTSFKFSNEDLGEFRETKNKRSIAKRYGIIDVAIVEESAGYYIASKFSLTKIMLYQMRMVFANYQNDDELYFWEFGVRAYEPELKCTPDVVNYDCSEPKVPMYITIDRQYTIAPIVKRNCSKNSILTFSWSVTDLFDRNVLHVFKGYTRRQLNILPYVMQFDDKSDPFQTFYVVKVQVDEQSDDGRILKGSSYFRCYVHIVMRSPLAKIEGGTKRQISLSNPIILNGTQSRDLSHPAPKTIQKSLTFAWACESIDDPTNSYCTQINANQPIATVPSNILSITKTYKFTLTVTSNTTDRSNSKSQSITITANDQRHLELNVICLKNCQTPVSTDAELFLRGEWISFPDRSIAIQYKWELENKTIGDQNRLILPANRLSKDMTYEIRLVVEADGAHGEYYYEFKTNKGIGNGRCLIEPKTGGWALKTIYYMICYNFESRYQPLEYKVYSNDRIVAASFNSRFSFRVRNNDKLLIIKVYDRYGETTSFNLPIDSKSIEIKPMDEYSSLAWDNDVQGIAAMIECQIDDLDKNSANKDETIVYLLNTLKNIEYSPTTFDMELGTSTLLKLLDAFDIDFDRALILFDVLDNYLTILHEFSYIDAILMTRSFIETLNTNFINIMDKLYKEFVPIPIENDEMYINDGNELKLYEDENYPDYPEFDYKALPKIIQLEQIINRTEKLWPSLNRIISKRLEVNETDIFYENNINIIKSFTVCNDEVPVVETKRAVVLPKFDINFDDSIFQMSRAELTINLKYFKNVKSTPFWWLPKSEKQFTNIFMVQLTEHNTGDSISNTNHAIINYHSKSDKSRRKRRTDRLNKIENTVYNRSDIVIYKINYAVNELILINFLSKSQSRLQIAFKSNSEPNYNDFKNSNPLYIVDQGERLIRLQYDQKVKLYMGVILERDDDQSRDANFSFTIESIACTNFDFVTRKWCTHNCKVAINSTKTVVNCSCTNQNTNLLSIYNKPKSIYFHNRYDREFLRKLPINLAIVIILLILMLLFLCLFLIILLKSRQSHKTKSDDRIIPYMAIDRSDLIFTVTIICGTNSFQNTVTTSNIGIQIYGDRSTSDQYIFKLDPSYSTNSDNTYQILLQTRSDFGDIKTLLLWIDYTGSTPSFDCDQIIISYNDRTYRFYIYDCLTLQYQNSNIIKLIDIQNNNQITFLKLFQRNYFKYDLIFKFYRNQIFLMLLFLRIVMIMLVFVLLMGPTTFENYKNYKNVRINYLYIGICIVIVVVVEKLIYYLCMKYNIVHV